MGQIGAKFSTDYDAIPKGTYLFEVKETTIDNTKPDENNKTRRKYTARVAITEGENEGMSHFESFYSDTKDDFSFAKLFGFMVKVGIIPTDVKTLNADYFKTENFEMKFRSNMKGRRFGARVGWKYKKDDTTKENPMTDLKVYYTVDEVKALMGPKPAGTTVNAQTAPAPQMDEFGRPIGTSPAPISTPAPEPPKAKAPWE